jgi:hypothetical protein
LLFNFISKIVITLINNQLSIYALGIINYGKGFLMSTEKQINANRQNAQKSTGPKSDGGKAAVSQNAVKHGIFAQSVIKGENEADYEAFHNKMLDELKPVGPTEILLAARIVGLWWRLERAERVQNQVIDVMIELDEPSPLQRSLQKCIPKSIGPDMRGAGPELALGRAIIKDYSDSRVLDRLMLYERRIENSLHKAMRELERRQLIRQYQQQEAEQEQSIPSTELRTGPIPINDNRDEAATQKSNQFQLAPSTAGGSITDLKKQSQSRPSVGNPKSEYLNPKQVKENTILKKQSRSVPVQNGTTSYLGGDYDKIPLCGVQGNKANLSYREQICPEPVERTQSQLAPRPALGVEKREKSVSAATG